MEDGGGRAVELSQSTCGAAENLPTLDGSLKVWRSWDKAFHGGGGQRKIDRWRSSWPKGDWYMLAFPTLTEVS